MKTHTFQTLAAFYGDPVTTYQIIPELIQGRTVYYLEVTMPTEAPYRLNSIPNRCEPSHRLFEYRIAERAMRKHNRENGNKKLIKLKGVL